MIDYAAIFRQLHVDYCREFTEVFRPSRGGTLPTSNADIPLVNTFIQHYTPYFHEREILLPALQLRQIGQRDIQTYNENCQIMLKLYGVSFVLYLHSCRFLNQQPNPDYTEAVLVKFEDLQEE